MPQDYIPRRSSSSSGSRRTSSTRESSSPSTVRRQSVRRLGKSKGGRHFDFVDRVVRSVLLKN